MLGEKIRNLDIRATRRGGTGKAPRVHFDAELGSIPSKYESRYGVRPARSSRSRSSSGDIDLFTMRRGCQAIRDRGGQIVKLSVVTIVAMLLAPIC